ncbi:WXG100 family type VII secretion target [Mobilisporobacter senegalensis]|uniref:ESAT-6-like protein n=1 Tax=Mobilisporobacter senegalensis TaxID=1329262 RepID=A0A3N1XYT4_9FIRM|nr:WXG100 family type VII secretion target [Mobilisporobacter senegalensis]ROR31750.1 WXG100 family type VII secretion target [Mobilisporobacter senegalensis]
MASIKVTPEELKTQGESIVKMGEEIDTKVTTLDTTINTVVNEWDGLAQDAFLEAYNELKETLKQFPLIVNGIGTQVVQAADTFGQTDSDLSGAFKQ